jgi:hypothetical protein
MKIEFVMLADAVESVNGKLYVMGGGWSQLNFPQYPAPARIGIAISFLLEPADAEKAHPFQVTVLNPTEAAVLPPIHGQVEVKQVDSSSTTRAFVTINSNVQIPMPGTYQVVVVGAPSDRKKLTFNAKLALPKGMKVQ